MPTAAATSFVAIRSDAIIFWSPSSATSTISPGPGLGQPYPARTTASTLLLSGIHRIVK